MPVARWRGWSVASLVGVLALGALPSGQNAPDTSQSSLTLQITSPLGRTGMVGPVRIVARISADPKASLSPVQFFVDEQLIGEDKDGPPYAVEWVDSNPFLPRSIVVQVADSLGTTAKDTVDLKPQELVDSTEVSSVVLEPMVFNKLGRPVNGLNAQDFSVLENDVPQTIDMAVPGQRAGDLHAAHRQQRQHGAPHRLRSRRRGPPAVTPSPQRFSHRGAVRAHARRRHGPDAGSRDDCQRHRRAEDVGRHGDPRVADDGHKPARGQRRPQHRRAHHRRVRRGQRHSVRPGHGQDQERQVHRVRDRHRRRRRDLDQGRGSAAQTGGRDGRPGVLSVARHAVGRRPQVDRRGRAAALRAQLRADEQEARRNLACGEADHQQP